MVNMVVAETATDTTKHFRKSEMYKMANYNITFSPTGGTKKVADILAKEIFNSHTDIDLCTPEAILTILC